MTAVTDEDIEALAGMETHAAEALRAYREALRAHDAAAIVLMKEARRHMVAGSKLADKITRMTQTKDSSRQ
jgi:hypothetical protein